MGGLYTCTCWHLIVVNGLCGSADMGLINATVPSGQPARRTYTDLQNALSMAH